MNTLPVRLCSFLFLVTVISSSLDTLAAPAGDDEFIFSDNTSMRVVDSSGKSISASGIPEDLGKRLKTIVRRSVRPLAPDLSARIAVTDHSPGLVIAKVKLPEAESDVHFNFDLVGNSWIGGGRYLNMGGGLDADMICMSLISRDGALRLEIRKLNYRTLDIQIPNIDPSGKLIWLGELALQPYGKGEGVQHVVSGKVVTTAGAPINKGEVSIRINGTPLKLRVPINEGQFSFEDIRSGDYLIEFWIDDYSVKTWWLNLNEREAEAKAAVTAYPRNTFAFNVNGTPLDVTAGIPYRESTFALPDGSNVSVTQNGDRIGLFCSKYLIQVTAKGRKQASHNWNGDLVKGDVIQILNPSTNELLNSLECLNVR